MSDPYLANVALLLPCANANLLSAFPDYSPTVKAITNISTTIIADTNSPYSTCSYFNGTSSSLSTPTHTDLDMSTGDFTIECWCDFQDQTTAYPSMLATQTWLNNSSFALRFDQPSYTQKVTVHWYSVGDPCLTSTNTFSFNTFRHIEVSRSGTTLRLFVNGNLEASTTTSTALNLTQGGTFVIGRGTWDGAGGYYKGKLYDIRITKGVARHTSSFTPPSKMVDTLYTVGGNINQTAIQASGFNYGGNYHITGITTRLGVAGAYLTRLYDHKSGRLAREITSNADGTYTFTNVSLPSNKYFIVAHDANASPINAAIADLINPS